MTSPAHPTAGGVIAALQRFIRGYFEAAASLDITPAAALAFEEVATTLSRCNPVQWCTNTDQLRGYDVADQIAASITLTLRDIDPATTNFDALRRVRDHFRGVKHHTT